LINNTRVVKAELLGQPGPSRVRVNCYKF